MTTAPDAVALVSPAGAAMVAERHVHVGPFVLARRPLVVGIVHGLAGSGALTALAVANLPTAVTQVAFIVMFALGSTVAMAGFSGFAGWPLARLARAPRSMAALSMASGLISIALGVMRPIVAGAFSWFEARPAVVAW